MSSGPSLSSPSAESHPGLRNAAGPPGVRHRLRRDASQFALAVGVPIAAGWAAHTAGVPAIWSVSGTVLGSLAGPAPMVEAPRFYWHSAIPVGRSRNRPEQARRPIPYHGTGCGRNLRCTLPGSRSPLGLRNNKNILGEQWQHGSVRHRATRVRLQANGHNFNCY